VGPPSQRPAGLLTGRGLGLDPAGVDLTCGGAGSQSKCRAQYGHTNPAKVPSCPTVARSHVSVRSCGRAFAHPAGPPWWRFPLQRCCARASPGGGSHRRLEPRAGINLSPRRLCHSDPRHWLKTKWADDSLKIILLCLFFCCIKFLIISTVSKCARREIQSDLKDHWISYRPSLSLSFIVNH
jgi:hypothetical protein